MSADHGTTAPGVDQWRAEPGDTRPDFSSTSMAFGIPDKTVSLDTLRRHGPIDFIIGEEGSTQRRYQLQGKGGNLVFCDLQTGEVSNRYQEVAVVVQEDSSGGQQYALVGRSGASEHYLLPPDGAKYTRFVESRTHLDPKTYF